MKDSPLVVPPGVVTFTRTVLLPDGATAVTCVEELTTKLVAAVPPKLTPVAPVRKVPVNVTDVPLLPLLGVMPVSVGAQVFVSSQTGTKKLLHPINCGATTTASNSKIRIEIGIRILGERPAF